MRSVGEWHNETMNIQTHLLPGAAYLLWMLHQLFPVRSNANKEVDVGMLVIGFGSFFGFGASALFHTMMCHSEDVAKICVRIDLLGVVVSLTSVSCTVIYHLYACEPDQRRATFTRIGMLTVFLCFICSRKEFAHRRWRHVKPLPFVLLGCALLHPMVCWAMEEHAYCSEGSASSFDTDDKAAVVHFLLAGWGLDAVAVAVFVSRIPERWSDMGRFDFVGNSHNIFHVLVVCASLCGLFAAERAKQGQWCVCRAQQKP